MARAKRAGSLENRTKRLKLETGKRHWVMIGKGLALGYRRGPNSSTWLVRLMVADRKHELRTIGKADDYQDANGIDVFDYFQAQATARQIADGHAKQEAGIIAAYTVENAVSDYLEWFGTHRKSLRETTLTCNAHILPALGEYEVAKLSTAIIRKWHEDLANAPARVRSKTGATRPATRQTTEQRPRQATANRVLTVLKAALNFAWTNGKVPSDDAWRKVKPFRNVDVPRVRFLSQDEITRLLNACNADARALAMGALQTGCRYGELAAMRAEDFDPDAGSVFIREPKNGKPRYVPLTAEGRRFFERLAIGKSARDALFLKDGRPWRKSEQDRAVKRAVTAAGVEDVSFHILRHCYGAALAKAGVPLQVIAEALGHSDTRITQRHYAHLQPSFVADTIRANLPSFGVETDNVTSLRVSQ